ncbi:ATP-binding cassette domain-containing protein [Tessaracoccus coleopterorum]|uniref:ATP-binding cassette domain-containing protein n=1 Tax=Tessaracoccus coleopterorum TaxID=2714950 RepID=UPI0022B23930|nr:ATP-binding cassette domain-containing protein [Tessaracoccus coleopterorum]
MVFQDYALFPHMDVSDNIAYPLRIRKVAKEERKKTAADTAGRLSLEHLLERRPGQLSGGQQQRVALARAIATRPRCSSSMSHCRTSTPGSGSRRARSSRSSSASSASPRCS